MNQSPRSENVWEYPIPAFVNRPVACVFFQLGVKLIERAESLVSKKKKSQNNDGNVQKVSSNKRLVDAI